MEEILFSKKFFSSPTNDYLTTKEFSNFINDVSLIIMEAGPSKSTNSSKNSF